nr:hypothetical protein [uncultured Roseateles sp.]
MAQLTLKRASRSQKAGRLTSVAVGVVFLAIAMLGGLATALFGKVATLFFSVLIVGFFGLVVPVRMMVPALVVMSFLVAGQLTYFARIDKALWLPFLIGLLLLIRFPFDLMQRAPGNNHQYDFDPKLGFAIKASLFVYFATLAASTAINTVGPLQILVSAKEYFFLWVLLLIFSFGLVRPELIEKIWHWLPWLMVFQIPLILYQRFVIAPSRAVRHMGAEWDAVVGAFGGNPEGGGASGAMGMFCVVAMAYTVARWRRGLIGGFPAGVLVLCGFASIALAEVKFAVLLLPLGFAVIYIRQFLKKPVETAFAMLAVFVISFSVLVLYKTQFSNDGESQSVGEYIESTFKSRSNDDDFVNYRTGELGRKAALVFWKQQHDVYALDKLLIGHGAGASRVGDMVVGEAAKRWPFNIARSSLAILLWETGVIGSVAVIAMLSFCFVGLFRYVSDERLSQEQQSLAAGMSVAVMTVAASLPYNTDFLFAHQTQILLLLSLGYLAQLNGKFSGRPEEASPSPAQLSPGMGSKLA